MSQADKAYELFQYTVDNYPLAYDLYSALVALVNAGIPVDDLNRGLVDYYAAQYGYALDAFQRYITAGLDTDGTAAFLPCQYSPETWQLPKWGGCTYHIH